jgi:hypothetical protein
MKLKLVLPKAEHRNKINRQIESKKVQIPTCEEDLADMIQLEVLKQEDKYEERFN